MTPFRPAVQETLVDEDGCYMSAAGPELRFHTMLCCVVSTCDTFYCATQETLVDEDGCYMSAAGPDLHRRPVLTEGDRRVLQLLGT